MPRITIRLSEELYQELVAHGDIAETTRIALQKHLGKRQNSLEERVEALETKILALSANSQTQEQTPRPHVGRHLADTYLGTLCHRGHDHEGTGKSLRSRVGGNCLACKRFIEKERKKSPSSKTRGEGVY